MEVVFFAIMALAAIGSALTVILRKNPVISAMFLILTLFILAIFYVMLGAPFIASMQVIVYSGAIMVMFIFVVMMLNLGSERKWGNIGNIRLWLGFGSAAGIFLVVAAALKSSLDLNSPLDKEMGSVSNFGSVLFRDYLLPFEAVSVLLLAAIVGTVILVKRKISTKNKQT